MITHLWPWWHVNHDWLNREISFKMVVVLGVVSEIYDVTTLTLTYGGYSSFFRKTLSSIMHLGNNLLCTIWVFELRNTQFQLKRLKFIYNLGRNGIAKCLWFDVWNIFGPFQIYRAKISACKARRHEFESLISRHFYHMIHLTINDSVKS